jgi:preprotein translocase subunit SecD
MKISFRVWVLIIVLILSLLAIRPTFESGVVVKSVERDSELYKQGLKTGEIIKQLNGEQVKTIDDYSKIIQETFLTPGEKKIEIKTKQNQYTILTNQTPTITVDNVPRTRIKTGLDLRGGSRALVKPEVQITDSQMQDLVSISRNRFNVYGLSDVSVKGVTDFSGQKFMLVEVAGATPADLEKLVAQQGKFEAKIANITVFNGGNRDISDVCRNDASCAGVTSCFQAQGGYACNFAFTIFLRQEAAQRQADLTRNISLSTEDSRYLSESLVLYVDDKEVDTLRISSDLRGQVTTQIQIQGSGSGKTQDEALKDARTSMNNLQTILLTGSLPYKVEIVKLDTISPTLGNEFISSIMIAAVAAIVVVSLIIFVRYRKIKASLALLLTSFSELLIILGVAALINWNLDLPSIAGILATIGTGVDQQIVILDEATHEKTRSLKERLKRASAIILTAYLTVVAAMLPLYWAGAGLFKGFALTTIIGVTAGVLVTRPAFADIVKHLEE